jgi:RecQ family ATP-dependent DNA helicase
MEYFIHLPDYRILICRSCKAAVIRCRVQPHLRDAPHKLEKSDIQQVLGWASKLDIVDKNKDIPSIPVPPEDSPPIEALGEPKTGGFRCTYTTNCLYVGTSKRRIREHLRDSHSWDQQLKGGRRSAVQSEEEQNDGPWRSGVLYQRFFITGQRSEYFEVRRGQEAESLTAEEQITEAYSLRLMEVFQSKANRIREKETEQIQEPDDFTAPNPWLRRLGSAIHLKDFSGKKDFLRGLIAMEYQSDRDGPDDTDDSQLMHIHNAFERVINRARVVTKPEVVSWNALFEVNRTELSKERSRPFHNKFTAKTQQNYTIVYRQLLAYVVRAMAMEDKDKRPPFKLSRRQSEAYDAMMSHADELIDAWKAHDGDPGAAPVAQLLSTLEGDVLELCISILDHLTKDTEYDSILVSFLTVLSIRPDDTWEGYSNFTPKLSAIMAISRLLVVKYAVDQRTKAIKQKLQQGQSQQEAEDNSPSHFELVADMTRRFMVAGGEGVQTTPVQFIIRLRNYGLAAHNNSVTYGSVSWDKEDLIFKGTRFNILDVQSMVQVTLRQAETVLFKKLLFCGDFTEQSPAELGLPPIPWDELLDNAADAAIGLSLIDSLYRQDGGASKGWVFRKLWTNEVLRETWVQFANIAEIKLDPKAACRYGMAVEKLLELLLFLTHLSYGQPARAPELLTVRYKNTAEGGVRNVLIDRGLIMIVTGYHKGFSRTERLKVIHRFLPREIGTLLVYYLWLVLPFWEELQANIWDKESFSAAIWAEEELSADEGKNTGGQRHTEGHSQGDIGDESDDNSSRQESQPESMHDPWKLGPGSHWTSQRMTRIMKRLSTAGCGRGLTISSWRHMAVAFGRRYFRDGSTAHIHIMSEFDTDNSDSDGEDDSPWDLQAGHGSRVAGLIYGRLITEGAFETNERRTHFRHVSEEWHRLLGFPSAMAGLGGILKPGRKRKSPSLHHEAMKNLQVRRWKTLRSVDIDRELGRLYGEQARFRGIQRQAIEAIMGNKSPVVVVMGTGGGKSMCFMLPAASCTGGITIVIVPLVSLQGDMLRRCQKLKISSAEWNSTRVPGAVSIVFVTPESAMTKRFQDYLEGLRVTAQLDRIVVDECHTILEGSKAFRPRLRELGQLGLVGVQMIYLTATLPPTKEDEFFKLLHSQRGDIHLIRSPTTRKNVSYSVQTIPANTVEEATAGITAAVHAIMDSKLEEYPWPAKMIIYCQRVQATEAVADELGCDAYHREVDTRDGKAERLKAWMGGIQRDQYGSGRVIVATNALGLGIDVPDIRVVMHVEMPYEMADYAQQSGRAGRDGEHSEAIVVRVQLQAERQGGSRGQIRTGLGIDDYLSGIICRRVVMDTIMDGRKDRVGCETGEEKCDVCKSWEEEEGSEEGNEEGEEEADIREREIAVQQLRGRAAQRAAQEQEELQRLKQLLEDRFLDGCIFCWSAGIEDRDHLSLQCPMAEAYGQRCMDVIEKGRKMERFLQREGIAERFGCCFGCFVPHELCNGWEEDVIAGGWQRILGKRCRYRGVVISTIAFTEAGVPDEALRLYKELGYEGEDLGESVWKWMGRRIGWAKMDILIISKVFLNMAEIE